MIIDSSEPPQDAMISILAKKSWKTGWTSIAKTGLDFQHPGQEIEIQGAENEDMKLLIYYFSDNDLYFRDLRNISAIFGVIYFTMN